MFDPEPIENRIGHVFEDKELLLRALTHPSFANEARTPVLDNQRLEFLGDAYLGAVITEALFNRHPEYTEGALSKLKARLVCEEALAHLGRGLDLGTHLRLGRGEESNGGRDKDSLLADAYEALVAAVYLDGGFPAARAMVLRLHSEALESTTSPKVGRDAKSVLQELLQHDGRPHPRYRTSGAEGPQHARIFTAEVVLDGEVLGVGEGRSKKQAQQEAAAAALARLREPERGAGLPDAPELD